MVYEAIKKLVCYGLENHLISEDFYCHPDFRLYLKKQHILRKRFSKSADAAKSCDSNRAKCIKYMRVFAE